jgi:hypothetical protein
MFLIIGNLSAIDMPLGIRVIQVLKTKRCPVYGVLHTKVCVKQKYRGEKNILICMHGYGKWYGNLHTHFGMFFKPLIVSCLFLILHGNKRAMKRSTTGLGVWGQGWGYRNFRSSRDKF